MVGYHNLCILIFSYYCRQGAQIATPTQGPDADECPAGFYCPSQSSEPQKCPAGTYSSNVRLTAETECTNCTAGSYCGDLNMTSPSGLCEAGYYCPVGSSSSTQISCPEGSYCPIGTHTPVPCPAGRLTKNPQLTFNSYLAACWVIFHGFIVVC